MVGLIRAEWLKITRQNTSRVMAGILLGIAALFVLIEATNVTGTSRLAFRQSSFDGLSFPNGFYVSVKDIIGNVGVLIVVVLVANTVGSEYGFDTWKNLLVRHQGRGRFIAAKMVVTLTALLGIFVATAAITQLFSSVGQVLVTDTAKQIGLTQSSLSSDQFLQNLYSESLPLLLYFGVLGAFATFCTVVGRSTVTGIIIPLVFWVGDNFSLRLLGPSSSLTNFTLSKNVSSLQDNLGHSGSGSMETWQSLLILGTYMLVSLVAAFVIFRQRDMAG